MKVIALPEVRKYLKDLVYILYQKEYFGFEETATKYVEELLVNIEKYLPVQPSKPAPTYFDRYGKGMFYAMFKKNKNTQWYVFFTKYKNKGETVYLIRYIGNNHTISQHL